MLSVESSRNAETNATPSPVDLRAEANRISVGNVTEVIDDSLDNELLESSPSGDDDSVNTDEEETAATEVNDGDVEMKDISGDGEEALNDVGNLFDA